MPIGTVSASSISVPAASSLPSVSPGNRVTPIPQPAGEYAGSRFYTLGPSRLQINILLFGDGGTGKTTFAVRYCPGPIAILNFDRRAKDAVRTAQSRYNKRILYQEIRPAADAINMDEKMAKEHGQEQLKIFLDEFHYAVRESQKGNIRTICIDTATELHEIFNMAISGRPDKAKDDFGKSKDVTNRQWWSVLNAARDGNAHLVLLARAKQIYQGREGTGRFTHRVPDVLNDGVDLTMELKVTAPGIAGGGPVIAGFVPGAAPQAAMSPTPPLPVPQSGPQWSLHVTKAGVNAAELGETYTSASWEMFGGPFVYACMRQYAGETPGSSPEDWK